MARDSTRRSTVEALEEEFVGALVKETGFAPSMALQIVRPIVQHLVANYPGERLYIPAPKRVYPVEEIRQAMARTENAAAVCERFGLSRATLYRLLEGAAGVD